MLTPRLLMIICFVFGSVIALSLGCDSKDCVVNSECGVDHLCREGICKPKCMTYLTCASGEACVDGACEVPSADYCSHVVPAQTPPEMGPYEPCPPSEMSVGEEAINEMGVAPETPGAGGEINSGMAGSEASSGTTVETGGVVSAGTQSNETAGETLGGENTTGAAGEGAGERAGESADESAGEDMGVIEIMGGQAE